MLETEIGRVLGGKYRLEELLGQGGMGKVFRATQLGLERRVAVKIMDASLAADAGALKRFTRPPEHHQGGRPRILE